MTQEAWNLTAENGKGMMELVMTIGLVPCWSRQEWATTAEEHQAPHEPHSWLHVWLCPNCSTWWSKEDGGTDTCWASYRPDAQLIDPYCLHNDVRGLDVNMHNDVILPLNIGFSHVSSCVYSSSLTFPCLGSTCSSCLQWSLPVCKVSFITQLKP